MVEPAVLLCFQWLHRLKSSITMIAGWLCFQNEPRSLLESPSATMGGLMPVMA